jgi:hypothetical protein
MAAIKMWLSAFLWCGKIAHFAKARANTVVARTYPDLAFIPLFAFGISVIQMPHMFVSGIRK